MVRKIEQFQKLNNSFSESLSPYERQEIFAQLPLWQECLNVCHVQLYAKFRDEDISESRSWREHPFKSYACFVKDHKKIQYHIIVFDIEEGYQPDTLINLKIQTAGEYRTENLLGNEILVFASNRYYLGISPVDSTSENNLFISNVKNAIGYWWYSTKTHNWACINKAVTKMKAKAEDKAVATVRPEQVLVLVGQTEPAGESSLEDVKPAVIVPVAAHKEEVDTTVLVPVGANLDVKQSLVDSLRTLMWHDVKEKPQDVGPGEVQESPVPGMSDEAFEDLLMQSVEEFPPTSYALADSRTQQVPPHEGVAVVYAPEPVVEDVRTTGTSPYERLLHPSPDLPVDEPLIILEPVLESQQRLSSLTPSSTDVSRVWSVATVPSRSPPLSSEDYDV